MRRNCAALLFLCGACHASRPVSITTPAEPDRELWTFDTADGLPLTPASFAAAKKVAMQIHAGHMLTFYCGCVFSEDRAVDARSCGYQPRNINKRGQRIEWEHIVPAYAFGRALACWTQKLCTDGRGRTYSGRRCCDRIDPQFRKMQADLRNLVPAVGELNGDRSNFPFGEIPGEARAYGACDFEVDRANRVAEPAEEIRGDIARTYSYMQAVYRIDLSLTEEQKRTLRLWSRLDPPDDWEKERIRRVMTIQRGRQEASAHKSM